MPKKNLTKLKKCVVEHCDPIYKKLTSEIKLYRKKLSNKCKNTKKNNVNECTKKYYKHPDNKEYRKLFNHYTKCNKKFCSKEVNELDKNHK